MNTNDQKVETMLKRAAESEKADDALKFSQAALNAANAIRVILALRILGGGTEIKPESNEG